MKHLWSIAVASILLLTGCTHFYLPKEVTFDMEKISNYSVQGNLNLVNAQDNLEQVLVIKTSGHQIFTNLSECTDTAIAIVTRELSNRGAKISTDGGKSLTLSVESISVTTGGWGFRGYADIQATTGDGYQRKYHGEVPSSLLYNAVDGALARAIIAMLNDETVMFYLSK
jgi:hypothetical protein